MLRLWRPRTHGARLPTANPFEPRMAWEPVRTQEEALTDAVRETAEERETGEAPSSFLTKTLVERHQEIEVSSILRDAKGHAQADTPERKTPRSCENHRRSRSQDGRRDSEHRPFPTHPEGRDFQHFQDPNAHGQPRQQTPAHQRHGRPRQNKKYQGQVPQEVTNDPEVFWWRH